MSGDSFSQWSLKGSMKHFVVYVKQILTVEAHCGGYARLPESACDVYYGQRWFITADILISNWIIGSFYTNLIIFQKLSKQTYLFPQNKKKKTSVCAPISLAPCAEQMCSAHFCCLIFRNNRRLVSSCFPYICSGASPCPDTFLSCILVVLDQQGQMLPSVFAALC